MRPEADLLLPRDAGYPADEIKKVEREVKQEVDAAVEAAKAAPIPPLSWLYRNMCVCCCSRRQPSHLTHSLASSSVTQSRVCRCVGVRSQLRGARGRRDARAPG